MNGCPKQPVSARPIDINVIREYGQIAEGTPGSAVKDPKPMKRRWKTKGGEHDGFPEVVSRNSRAGALQSSGSGPLVCTALLSH